jgi:hypothetical protein
LICVSWGAKTRFFLSFPELNHLYRLFSGDFTYYAKITNIEETKSRRASVIATVGEGYHRTEKPARSTIQVTRILSLRYSVVAFRTLLLSLSVK